MNMLQLFVDLLASADAIKVDDGVVLTDWTAEPVTGDDDHIVLTCTWADDDYIYQYELSEKQVAAASFDVNKLCFDLLDDENQPTTVAMYTLMPLVPVMS